MGVGVLPVKEEENGIVVKSRDLLINQTFCKSSTVSQEKSSLWYLLVWLQSRVQLSHLDKSESWKGGSGE